MTKPSLEPVHPSDIETFLKSKTIGDLSLKTILFVLGALCAVLVVGFTAGSAYVQNQNLKTTAQNVIPGASTPEPIYTYPVSPVYPVKAQPDLMWLSAPILYTKTIELHQCVDKMKEALLSVGFFVDQTSSYEKGAFVVTGRLESTKVMFLCHRTSIGGAVGSAVLTSSSADLAEKLWGIVLTKLPEWRGI